MPYNYNFGYIKLFSLDTDALPQKTFHLSQSRCQAAA